MNISQLSREFFVNPTIAKIFADKKKIFAQTKKLKPGDVVHILCFPDFWQGSPEALVNLQIDGIFLGYENEDNEANKSLVVRWQIAGEYLQEPLINIHPRHICILAVEEAQNCIDVYNQTVADPKNHLFYWDNLKVPYLNGAYYVYLLGYFRRELFGKTPSGLFISSSPGLFVMPIVH